VTAKAVNASTAWLLRELEHAAPLPVPVRDDPDALAAAERLVLDGLLEVEIAGRFVTGAAAGRLRSPDTGAGSGPLAALSLAALRYGTALGKLEPLRLSERLYFYNRVPATPGRRRALGAAAARAADEMSRTGWRKPRGAEPAGWYAWRRPGDRSTPRHKLYVSPRPDESPEAAVAAARVLAGSEALALKLGRDGAGLLRPDKLVAYFASRVHVQAAAGAVSQALAGCPAQGVPFSAALDDDGLVSWGVDPPPQAGRLPWDGSSWRRSVTDQLARALLEAHRAELAEPWRHALARVERAGVDTATWAPAA
jgi:hypothetical protein